MGNSTYGFIDGCPGLQTSGGLLLLWPSTCDMQPKVKPEEYLGAELICVRV